MPIPDTPLSHIENQVARTIREDRPKDPANSKTELTNLELRKQLKEAEGIISTLMASANTTRTLTKLTKVQAYQWLLAQATASEDS